MGKYIIELEREEIAYKTVNSNGTPMIQLLAPAPYTEPGMEQVWKEAYDKGYDDAAEEKYNDGLADAWECVDKINSMSHKEQEECFGRTYLVNIMELEPSEAIEKIRQYEQEKEEQIQVGDEIETPSGLKGYVVNFTDDELVHYVSSEGRFGTIGMSAVLKTGRHFPEIAEVLAKMNES